MITIEQLKHCNFTDIETTGLTQGKHGIISIGSANILDDDIFYAELQLEDGVEFEDEALKVNGETKESLLNRKGNLNYLTVKDGIDEYVSYILKKGIPVTAGKNPSFDYKFLKFYWDKYYPDKKFPLSYRVINWADFALPLYLISGGTIPSNGLGSTELSNFLGVPPEQKPHIAINGALQNKKCVMAILEKYKSFKL